MELLPGNKVFRYTLVERLGKGGQGAVWKVIDPDDKSLKALKLVDLAALRGTAAERARHEAKAVRDLSGHPAIVPCHVLFDLPEALGLVFDLVRGPALSDVMRDPRMTREHRIAVLGQLASALAHVHARGLVHRDIKPSNILLTEAFWGAPDAPGSVKLVDFGIVAPASGNTKRITVEGRPVGTAPYLAPEILSRSASDPPPPEGFTQDVFAFGVLGFELFVGAHPTGLSLVERRSSFAEAYRLAEAGRGAWPPPGLDWQIAPVLTRCLALDPAQRIPNGGELARLLGVDAPRASRPSLKSAPNTATTASHTPPTDLPVAPRSSAGAYTTPHEAPSPNRPRTRAPLASRPPEEDWAPPPPRRSSSQTLPWIVAGFSLLCLVGFVSWQLGRSGSTLEGAAATNPRSSPSPRPDTTTDARAAYVPMPCCGSSGACKSDWACGPGDCGAGMPDRWYRLRISGVDAQTPADEGRLDSFSDDYSRSHPRARICVKRLGANEPSSCSLLTDVAATKKGDGRNRARVSTADLEGGGLEIWVEENGMTLARGRTGVPVGGGFLITALCDGIKLYLGPKETSPIRVWAYLDPG